MIEIVVDNISKLQVFNIQTRRGCPQKGGQFLHRLSGGILLNGNNASANISTLLSVNEEDNQLT